VISRGARSAVILAIATAALVSLSACASNTPTRATTTAATSITVASSASKCAVSASTAPSGTVNFRITNSADQVTEFYVLAEDGARIIGEAENIAPGAPRTLTRQLTPGRYFTACKPGMVGSGVGQAPFTVTKSGAKTELTVTKRLRPPRPPQARLPS
jgi:iron uptake system component EfeO